MKETNPAVPPQEHPSTRREKKVRARTPRVRPLAFLKMMIILAVAALTVFAGLRAFTGVFGAPWLQGSLVQTEQTLSADGLLVAMRGTDELHLLEYVQKTVFPFDYIEPGTDLSALVRAIEADRDGRPVEEILTPREWRSFEAFDLARSTGFDPNTPGSPFLVITLVHEFGYHLDEDETPILSLTEEDGIEYLDLSHPALLRIRIEDPSRGNYPYPDVRMSASNWRRISEFVLWEAEENPEIGEILEQARDQARLFFSGILTAGGKLETRIRFR